MKTHKQITFQTQVERKLDNSLRDGKKWSKNAIQSLEHSVEDLKSNQRRFAEAIGPKDENRTRWSGLTDVLSSTVMELTYIHGNIRLDTAVRVAAKIAKLEAMDKKKEEGAK